VVDGVVTFASTKLPISSPNALTHKLGSCLGAKDKLSIVVCGIEFETTFCSAIEATSLSCVFNVADCVNTCVPNLSTESESRAVCVDPPVLVL